MKEGKLVLSKKWPKLQCLPSPQDNQHYHSNLSCDHRCRANFCKRTRGWGVRGFLTVKGGAKIKLW